MLMVFGGHMRLNRYNFIRAAMKMKWVVFNVYAKKMSLKIGERHVGVWIILIIREVHPPSFT